MFYFLLNRLSLMAILFGGLAEGADWTHLSPAAQPPARAGHAMVYDAAHGQVVLFGGNGSFQGFGGAFTGQRFPGLRAGVASDDPPATDQGQQQPEVFARHQAKRVARGGIHKGDSGIIPVESYEISFFAVLARPSLPSLQTTKSTFRNQSALREAPSRLKR